MSKLTKMMGGAKGGGSTKTAQSLLPSVEPSEEEATVKTAADVLPPMKADTGKRRKQGSVALGL